MAIKILNGFYLRKTFGEQTKWILFSKYILFIYEYEINSIQ